MATSTSNMWNGNIRDIGAADTGPMDAMHVSHHIWSTVVRWRIGRTIWLSTTITSTENADQVVSTPLESIDFLGT